MKIAILFWRRWRDSNSRGAFDPYTISNRARSTNYATSPCVAQEVFELVSFIIIRQGSDKVKDFFAFLAFFCLASDEAAGASGAGEGERCEERRVSGQEAVAISGEL